MDYRMLQCLEWHESLRAVWCVRESEPAPDAAAFAQVSLVFEHHVLVLTPIADTDEIGVEEIAMADFRVTAAMEQLDLLFAPALGKRIMDAWHCTNSRGYRDLIVFSFEHLLPDLAFLAIGSALKLFHFRQAA